jgi:NAD-dependent DNA ligase
MLSKYRNKDVNSLVKLAQKADKAYYNSGNPIMTDAEYDELVEMIRDKDPNHTYLNASGASVKVKQKVRLPFHMGSITKPNDKVLTSFIEKFKSKYSGPYFISAKLDGVSALLYQNKLYSRARTDEGVGMDISNLLNVIDISYSDSSVAIRGELIMSKDKFEHYSDEEKSARNTVAGMVNAKNVDERKARDITFVAYELVNPWVDFKTQMKLLKQMGLEVVKHEFARDIDEEYLLSVFRKYKNEYKYMCDGVIISPVNAPDRSEQGNPQYTFAYKKMSELNVAQVTVKYVEWNTSKDGYINPTVVFEPVDLGVIVQRATAFNAAYIQKHKIGAGAVIEVVRAGDVTPYIKKVVRGARAAQMPDIDYKWNTTGVDIIATGYSSEQKAKEFERFFKMMKMKGLSIKIAEKLIRAGIDSIQKIMSVKKDDLRGIEGFKDKMVDNIYRAIQEGSAGATLPEFMAATNMFGRGFAKTLLKSVLDVHPDILQKYATMNSDDFYALLISIEGFGEERSLQFQNNMKSFLKLLVKMPAEFQDRMFNINVNSPSRSSGSLQGKKYVFSGFRNEEWKDIIEASGGKVVSTISKETSVLVVKDIGSSSSKTQKARELGVKIMDIDEFKKLIIKIKKL